jgi:hypothetical protein
MASILDDATGLWRRASSAVPIRPRAETAALTVVAQVYPSVPPAI